MDADYTGITIRIKPGSPRAERFQQVFGRLDRIPVVRGTPNLMTTDNGDDQPAYELNLTRLSSDELLNLIIYYADTLRQMPDAIRQMLKEIAVPILADDCEIERDE